MSQTQFSVRIESNIKNALDKLVDGNRFRNRSHLIQYILEDWLHSQKIVLEGRRSEQVDHLMKTMRERNREAIMSRIVDAFFMRTKTEQQELLK